MFSTVPPELVIPAAGSALRHRVRFKGTGGTELTTGSFEKLGETAMGPLGITMFLGIRPVMILVDNALVFKNLF